MTERRRWRPRLARLAKGAGAVVGALLVAAVALRLAPGAPLREAAPLSTAVYDAEGRLLRLTRAADGQYRLWTPLDDVAPALVRATLLYEDRHFFHHPGVNPASLVRGAASLLGGGRRIGGSTLTMQLARRLYGLDSSTPGGKLRQMGRALALELRHGKRELLEAYLNLAPYGGNVEGVGAAAAILFGRRADALQVGEALALAVIPQSPARRGRAGGAADPSLLTARAALAPRYRARHALSPADEASLAAPLGLRAPAALPFRAPHFVDQRLAEAERDGRAGAALETTLDPGLQALLERQIRGYVARHARRGLRNAAALLVDHQTMEVKALVGSADFFDDAIAGQVNGTAARRSPGSALKPFAYALGLEQGVIHPLTLLRDVPTAFGAYSPENFDGRFVGPLTAQEALVRSRNIPALSVAAALERPSLYGFLAAAGVDLPRPEAHYGLGLVLGTAEVTMDELVTLYAALANRGVLRPLRTGRGREGPAAIAGARVLSEEAAYLTLEMLAQNPRPDPPITGARRHGPSALPVAWKTGTSWGFRDAWSVGVFGRYVLGVWIGDFSGAGNPAFVGVQAAAPLFFEVADAILQGGSGADLVATTSGWRRRPAGLRTAPVCALSGGLPTSSCPHVRSTTLLPGRAPARPCSIHRTFALDAAGRRTCGVAAPPARHEVYEVWPSDLGRLFAAAGLPRRAPPPPAPGCEDDGAAAGAAPRITSPLAGVTYSLRRRGRPGDESIALQATLDGDAGEVFWFVGDSFVGRGRGSRPLFWRPREGQFLVRAVDDRGRADARVVRVEWLR